MGTRSGGRMVGVVGGSTFSKSAGVAGAVLMLGCIGACASNEPGGLGAEAPAPMAGGEPAAREEPGSPSCEEPAAVPETQANAPQERVVAPDDGAGAIVRLDASSRTTGRPDWFTTTPVLEDGRLTLSADASARTVREARAAAVDAGIARMRASLGFEPADADVILTSMVRLPTGWYKAYIMMSAPATQD